MRRALPLAAVLLACAGVALLWPGVATYDTLSQFRQASAGVYDDWHPPIMARLWSLLLAAGLRGTGPLLALQWAMLWAGLGLVARALARGRVTRAAVAALAVGLFPPLDSWMACVLKDCQLVGALTLATGLVVEARLAGRRLRPPACAGVALLLGYAALLRANAVFSVVPLALAWADWGGVRRAWRRALLTVAACAAVIGASGPINHRLLGAEDSHVARTLPLFDMAGIAHRVPLATLPGLPPAEWRHAERIGCVTPFFWDPFGDAARCGPVATRLAFARDEDRPAIEREWATMILRHPIAYAAHRLAHLNATWRIVAPADERLAIGPPRSLANAAGLGAPDRAAAAWLSPLAAGVARTPAGVPGLWLLLACGLCWTFAGAPDQPARALGLALATSAIVQEASFAVVSIASDLRYHLWPIVATMLAAALLGASSGVPRRRLGVTLAVVAAAALLSIVVRARVTAQIG